MKRREAPRSLVRFGPYRLDPGRGTLQREDEEIALPPRALGVLECLLRQPGQLVRKQELLDFVWDDSAVTEQSVTEAVKLLRQALGDDAGRPTYIQTVHRRGYRFIAPVLYEEGVEEAYPARRVSGEEAEQMGRVAAAGQGKERWRFTGASGRWKRALGLGVAVFLLGAIAGGMAIRNLAGSSGRSASEERQGGQASTQRFTVALPSDYPLNRVYPAVATSRDGTRLAYVALQEEGAVLLAKRMEEVDWTPLGGTEGAGFPVFSPDGRWIAFTAPEAPDQPHTIKKVPVTGGPTTTLARGKKLHSLTWEPDG